MCGACAAAARQYILWCKFTKNPSAGQNYCMRRVEGGVL